MSRPVLSIERRIALCQAFPHYSDAQLAEQFGLTVRQVQHIGFTEGLRKTAETLSQSAKRRGPRVMGATLKQRVKQAIVDAGDAGLSRDGIESVLSSSSPSSITTSLNKLVAEEQVFRAGRTGRSRWFATKLQAQAHFDAVIPPARTAREAPVKITHALTPARMPIAPRIPEGLKVQYGHPVPGPEARWHTNAQPILKNLGPGVYTDEPSSWVIAVTARKPATGLSA